MDSVSAKGFSMGYIGSVLLLIVSLVLIQMPDTFGFEDAGSATKFVFLIVGIWWFFFSHIAFFKLKDQPTKSKITIEVLNTGFKELKKVFISLKEQIDSIRFLSAFFFYSMGVQSIMLLAPLFAAQEVGMESAEMIIVILIIQLVAVGGAYLFAIIASKFSNKASIMIAILIWVAICIFAYAIKDKTAFYLLAGLLGLVMGGIQSVSRSTFSKLIPSETKDTASYFSFYDVSEKLAIVIGTASYASILSLTGTMRNSILFMIIFFIISIFFLSRTKLNN